MSLRLLAFLSLIALWAPAQQIVPGRFIVELDSAPIMGSADAAARLGSIGAEQDQVAALLASRRVTVSGRVGTVANALLVRARDASVLAGLPGVKRVEAVRRMKPHLYRALPIHQVPQAWELVGGMENAGAGIKIGILDTGIESSHPGFQADDMTVPDGYPLVSLESDRAMTNNKVIVARAFDGGSAAETVGHGTAVAMCAAGVRHQSPNGPLSGVAPRAWIGAYRVIDINDGYIYSDVVLEALDAAAADGMDVVNMSFGSVGAFGASAHSVTMGAIGRMAAAGIVLVRSGGQYGVDSLATTGPMTIDDTASAEAVIGVGANIGAVTAVEPSVGPSYEAVPSSNVAIQDPLMGPLVDIASIDPSGLACGEFDEGTLIGTIVVIRRGECYFYEKLANVAHAGAIAAVVYNRPDDDDPESVMEMDVSEHPTIPGVFVAYSSGVKLKQTISENEDIQALLRFEAGTPTMTAAWQYYGPSVELAIKPDLVATGEPIYTAVPKATSGQCVLCDPSGYGPVRGTSFSAPIVSGAVAVLKSARPGLASADYRSLIINGASPMYKQAGMLQPVQSAGAGVLNLKNSVVGTAALAPVSLSFSSGGGTVSASRDFILKNVGSSLATYALGLETADSEKPALSANSVQLEAGASATVSLAWAAAGLTPGAYQGFVRIVDTGSGNVARLPYWYAAAGGEVGSIVVLRSTLYDGHNPQPGEAVGAWVRVHDVAGLVLTAPRPDVVPVSGGGTVLAVADGSEVYPNAWYLLLGTSATPGMNSFRITAGAGSRTISIVTGQ